MPAQDNLFDAIQKGDEEEGLRLLGLTPDWIHCQKEQLSPILFALENHKPQIAQILRESQPELSIFEACALGDLPTVENLLDQTPELVNEYSAAGYQPLTIACHFGQAEIADFLIRNYANVNALSRNEEKIPPILSATNQQQDEIALMLLEAGADVNASDSRGYTPLHLAAENGQTVLVELYLEYGANPDAQLDDGRTPLDIAREVGNEEVIACLTGKWKESSAD